MDRLRTIVACAGLLLAGAGLATIFRPEPGPARPTSRAADARDEAALRDRVALLEQVVRAQGRGRSGSRQGSDDFDPDENPGGTTLEEREAERAARRDHTDRRYAFMQATLDREPVDPEWAPRAEQAILDAASKIDPRSSVTFVDCHTTLCKVEAEHPGVAEGEAFRGDLAMSVTLLPRATMRRVPADGMQPERSVMYFAKSGARLPRMPDDQRPAPAP